MLITFNFKDIKLLSLQFLILLINDFLIYIIFFIWYLLYQLNIVISPNPLFAYILTLSGSAVFVVWASTRELIKKSTSNTIAPY